MLNLATFPERTDNVDIGAERNTLACLIKTSDAWLRLPAGFSTDDFSEPLNRSLYTVIDSLYGKGAMADIVSVYEALPPVYRKELEDLGGGGWGYLQALQDLPIDSKNITYEAEKLVELTTRRRISLAGEKIQDLSTNKEPLPKIREKVELAISEIDRAEGAEAVNIGVNGIEFIDQRMAAPKEVPGLSSGFPQVDKVIQGFQAGRLYVVGARKKTGKAQPLWSLVATPSGFRRMGDICVGDYVIDRYGQPTQVQGVYDWGSMLTYKVTFSDGGSTVTTGQHEFVVSYKDREDECWEVQELLARGLKRPDGGNRFRIPVASPIDLPEKVLPLDPYVLGAWLGDGSFSSSTPDLHGIDLDIFLRVRPRLPKGDYLSLGYGKFAICGGGTAAALEKLGLKDTKFDAKFIPEEYLTGSIDQRLELLRGLLDTDGYLVNRNQVEWSFSNKRLSEQTRLLAASLGARVFQVRPKETGRAVAWRGRATFSGLVPFSLPRKASKFASDSNRHSRYITSIEPFGKEQVRCISVSSSTGTYLTDDFTVTHNSMLLLNWAKHIAIDCRKPVLWISTEHSINDEFSRLLSLTASVPELLINNGVFSQVDKYHERVEMANETIMSSPFFFVSMPMFTMQKIRHIARKMVRVYGVQAIFFDFIKTPESDSPNKEWLELGNFAYGLKALGETEHVPVISACQVNREGIQNFKLDGDIDSDHFAGSDRIAHAVSVAFVLRQPNKEEISEFGGAHGVDQFRVLKISDNRHGPSGKRFLLDFDGEVINMKENKCL
jgi:replicative DNA helicase